MSKKEATIQEYTDRLIDFLGNHLWEFDEGVGMFFVMTQRGRPMSHSMYNTNTVLPTVKAFIEIAESNLKEELSELIKNCKDKNDKEETEENS